MAIKELTKPDGEPITLTEVKLVATEDGTAYDTMFTRVWIPTARRQAEVRTGWTFARRGFQQTFDGFCDHGMKLRPPLISVESVKYLDLQGQLQTLPPSEYQVVTTELEGLLLPAIGGSFPNCIRRAGAVQVEYTAGYLTNDDVPENAKQWMLMAVATWYQQREGMITGTINSELPRDFMAALLDEFCLERL